MSEVTKMYIEFKTEDGRRVMIRQNAVLAFESVDNRTVIYLETHKITVAEWYSEVLKKLTFPA